MIPSKLILLRNTTIRYFSTVSSKLNGYNSYIPLISPMVNNRLLGKEHFDTTIMEDTILELLEEITIKPVPISKYAYHNFKNMKTSNALPKLKEIDDFSKYIGALTLKSYPHKLHYKIDSVLMETLENSADKLTEEDFLNILFYYHYTGNRKKFYVLETMLKTLHIPQSIDIDNILLSANKKPMINQALVQRMEKLADKGMKANNNTWYYIFNVFKNPEPKHQMLTLMKELEITPKPILTSLTTLTKLYTPEKIRKLYEENGYTQNLASLTPPLFNQLAQSYINHGRLQELFDVLQSDPKLRKFFTPGLFVHVATHLLENNQLGFAFALSNLFTRNYFIPGTSTDTILKSMILNVYLPKSKYFDNWLSLARIVYPEVSTKQLFINDKTLSSLNDFCNLHKIENSFKKKTDKELKLMNNIKYDLVWHDRVPNFDLEKNTPEFVKVAKKLNQCD